MLGLSFYEILNIPSELRPSLEPDLEEVERFHSYFHFEQSFLYLLSAYIYLAIGDRESSSSYIEKALFQDHFNEPALLFKEKREINLSQIFSYDKNYKYEKDFLKFALGDFRNSKEIDILDEASRDLFFVKFETAPNKLNSLSYPSHRLLVAKGLCFLYEGSAEKAASELSRAEKLLEYSHADYHKYASGLYEKRANTFKESGRKDLAENDMRKARNLFSTPRNLKDLRHPS